MHQPTDKNAVWLNTTETILLVGSVGTSVASVVLQQVTFAAITSVQLSLILGLNSLNRKRFDDLNQKNQNAIAQIQQQLLKEQSSVHQIEASIRQLPTHQDITTLQQLNESAIAQIQHQLLQRPFAQIEANIRQLPTYQDISTLQQQLEQLKTDQPQQISQLNQDITTLKRQLDQLTTEHQKRLNQLNEDINNQEHQFDQINIGLNSLRQEFASIAPINTDDLKSRIHNLKAYFEVKLRDIESNFGQKVNPKIETRLDEIEKNVSQIQAFTSQENSNSFFNNQSEDIYNDIQQLKTKTHQLSHLVDSNSQKTEELFTSIQRQKNTDKQSPEANTSVDDLIDFLQSEIDELDKRQKQLSDQLNSHSSSVTQRFQKLQVDLATTSISLKSEIAVLRHYVSSHQHIRPEQESPQPEAQTICEKCSKICETIVRGGLLNNCSFCSEGCKRAYEYTQLTEGH